MPQVVTRSSLPQRNEPLMLERLASGPIAVRLTVDSSFFEYTGGVFTSTMCGGPPNHVVVIVGAGVEPSSGLPYWLIRNSWGPDWGEGGHMRILRNAGGNGM